MRETLAFIRDRPPPDWDALLETDPNATPAHRPPLWDAFASVLPGMRVRFVAVERGGVLIGGAPVVVERRAAFHWLHAMPFVLPGAPLAREGAHAEVDAAVAVALRDLARGLGAIGGEWSLYRPEGPAPAAEAVAIVPGETRAHDTWLVDLAGGPEAAWRRLDRDARHMLRGALRGTLRFDEEPEALDEAYAMHLGQARRWGGYRPLPLELSRRLLAAGDGGGPAARLFTVRARGGLVAALLFLDHARELFAWWSGARADGRAFRATPFLFWRAIEWAAAAGRARLNLGGGAGREGIDAFKRQFGARLHRHPVRWMDAGAAPVAGRLVAGLQAWVRRGRFRGAPA